MHRTGKTLSRWTMVACLIGVVLLGNPSFGFLVFVDTAQLSYEEAKSLLVGNQTLPCDGLWGSTPPGLSARQTQQLVSRMTPSSFVVSEDVLFPNTSGPGVTTSFQVTNWTRAGITPAACMCYPEYAAGWDPHSYIPGFDIWSLGWTPWNQVWDQVLDPDTITWFARTYGASRKVVILTRCFNNVYLNGFGWVNYRNHFVRSFAHPDVSGACFEAVTTTDAIDSSGVVDFINTCLSASPQRTVYIILSPGRFSIWHPPGPYGDRVQACFEHLRSLPNRPQLENDRLVFVCAAYERERTGVEFFKSDGGTHSVQDAVSYLRSRTNYYRTGIR